MNKAGEGSGKKPIRAVQVLPMVLYKTNKKFYKTWRL